MSVSDEDVRSKLRELLPTVDLQTTTERNLREQLQEIFGCNLKARKQIFKVCEIHVCVFRSDVSCVNEPGLIHKCHAIDNA